MKFRWIIILAIAGYIVIHTVFSTHLQPVGYLFVDNDTLRIWNVNHNVNPEQEINYFFNWTSLVQLTNHYNDFWTKNVFCGAVNHSLLRTELCVDNATLTRKVVKSDNLTYVNVSGTIDISGHNFTIDYELFNDSNMIDIYIGYRSGLVAPLTNFDFIWKITEISIGNHTLGVNSIRTSDFNDTLANRTGKIYNNLQYKDMYLFNSETNEYLILEWAAINKSYDLYIKNGTEVWLMIHINGVRSRSGERMKFRWIDEWSGAKTQGTCNDVDWITCQFAGTDGGGSAQCNSALGCTTNKNFQTWDYDFSSVPATSKIKTINVLHDSYWSVGSCSSRGITLQLSWNNGSTYTGNDITTITTTETTYNRSGAALGTTWGRTWNASNDFKKGNFRIKVTSSGLGCVTPIVWDVDFLRVNLEYLVAGVYINLVDPKNITYNGTIPTLNFNWGNNKGDVPTECRYVIDGDNVNKNFTVGCNTNGTALNFGDGQHNVTMWVMDDALVANKSSTVAYSVMSAPNVTLIEPPSGYQFNGTSAFVNLTCSVVDASDILNVTILTNATSPPAIGQPVVNLSLTRSPHETYHNSTNNLSFALHFNENNQSEEGDAPLQGKQIQYLSETGKFGRSWYFVNGSLNYTGLNNFDNNAATFMAWIRPNWTISDTVNNHVLLVIKGLIVNRHIWIGAKNDSQFYYNVFNGANRTLKVQTSTILNTSQWTHIAAVWDTTGNMTLYVDGTRRNTTAFGGIAVTPTRNVTIGSDEGYWGPNDFNGNIDEVLVFNGTLSDGAIQELYNRTNPIKSYQITYTLNLSDGSYNWTCLASNFGSTTTSGVSIFSIIEELAGGDGDFDNYEFAMSFGLLGGAFVLLYLARRIRDQHWPISLFLQFLFIYTIYSLMVIMAAIATNNTQPLINSILISMESAYVFTIALALALTLIVFMKDLLEFRKIK